MPMNAVWRSSLSQRERVLPLLLIVAFIGCNKSPDSNSTSIVVSGDTAGWITPCGCASNQSGGLMRRATLLADVGKPERVLYLDAGGSAAGTSEYQQVKLEAILRGLTAMGRSPSGPASRGCRPICRPRAALRRPSGVSSWSATGSASP